VKNDKKEKINKKEKIILEGQKKREGGRGEERN